MNAQLKESQQKFTLAAGTTNRHQWHKKTVAALQELDRLKTQTLEKWGTIGGEERENVVSIMFGGITNETAAALYAEIGERFDLPAGSFKESGTGVNSVMVIIDKDHGDDLPETLKKQSD